MRVKVECGPPLPSVKAWFVVPAVSTIEELKVALCFELPGLRQFSAENLTLSLEGFELIDSSSIDAIRDGELITVKQAPTGSNKRKSTEETSLPSPKRVKRTFEPHHSSTARTTSVKPSQKTTDSSQRPVTLVGTVHDEESSSSSDSDSDSDDSESSSESDSDSSDDDTSSSSDSSSAPSVISSRSTPKQGAKAALPQRKQDTVANGAVTNHVPPGQGKAATQNRNARRRRKKSYERTAAQTEPPSANDIPLGERRAATFDFPEPDEPSSTVAPTIMMASLSNKNKRKGFKQAMANALPKKVVFSASTAAEAEQAPLPFTAAPGAEMTAAAPNIFPRLVPPSEKQENGQLPANMFVTSIDVEEGMHSGGKKNRKKVDSSVRHEAMEVENLVLDYGEADNHIPTQREPESSKPYADRDWTDVERKWTNFPKISDGTPLPIGTLVGWKALGINPVTFTPEFLLNGGRVVSISGHMITVQPLYKPGEVALGEELDEEAETAYEEETFHRKADICDGDWRII